MGDTQNLFCLDFCLKNFWEPHETSGSGLRLTRAHFVTNWTFNEWVHSVNNDNSDEHADDDNGFDSDIGIETRR